MRENAKEAPWPYSKHILSLQLFLGQWRHIFFHFFHSLYEWKRMNIPCHVDRCWWHYDPCFWRDISSPITGLLDTVHSHRVRLRLQWRGMRPRTTPSRIGVATFRHDWDWALPFHHFGAWSRSVLANTEVAGDGSNTSCASIAVSGDGTKILGGRNALFFDIGGRRRAGGYSVPVPSVRSSSHSR